MLGDWLVVSQVLPVNPAAGRAGTEARRDEGRNARADAGDETGRSRWSRVHHSATPAICGIHPLGTPPAAVAAEIARTVTRIAEQRRSGVALSARPRLLQQRLVATRLHQPPSALGHHRPVVNDCLRHMLIGYTRVSKTAGSQSLDLQRDALAGRGHRRGQPLPRPRLRRTRRPAGVAINGTTIRRTWTRTSVSTARASRHVGLSSRTPATPASPWGSGVSHWPATPTKEGGEWDSGGTNLVATLSSTTLLAAGPAASSGPGPL